MQRSSSLPSSSHRAENSLRVVGDRLVALLDAMDAHEHGSESKKQRRFTRWPFRASSVEVLVRQPGGTSSTFRVIVRNLSKGGVAVLHRAFIHPGSQVEMQLPTIKGENSKIAGKVCRVRHVGGMVYEIGVNFNKHLDLAPYFKVEDRIGMINVEEVAPESITGHLLVVEDCGSNQTLFRHYLSKTSLRLTMVATVADALKAIPDQPDAVLCDYYLPDGTAADFIRAAGREGLQAPVIITTASNDPKLRPEMCEVGAVAVLTKPITPAALIRVISEHLLAREAAPTEYAAGNVRRYVAADLLKILDSLEEAAKTDDLKQCLFLLSQIKGAAPSIGLEYLGRVASHASDFLAWAGSVKEAEKPLADVLALRGQCKEALSTPE
jgi:CheY-like chemotaxis protein